MFVFLSGRAWQSLLVFSKISFGGPQFYRAENIDETIGVHSSPSIREKHRKYMYNDSFGTHISLSWQVVFKETVSFCSRLSLSITDVSRKMRSHIFPYGAFLDSINFHGQTITAF